MRNQVMSGSVGLHKDLALTLGETGSYWRF